MTGLGHRVIGIDRDTHKVDSVLAGRSPFFEPGLDEMVSQGVRDGRLKAVTNLSEGIAEADIALICVGTPSEKSGNLDLAQLRRVVNEIGSAIEHRSKPLIVAI